MGSLLSAATIDAIASICVRQHDVEAAFRAVGIEPQRPLFPPHRSATIMSFGQKGFNATLARLDLSDPDTVGRLLRFTARLARLYAAGADRDMRKLTRLQLALADDGFSLDAAGDPLAAIASIATTAGSALPDAAAIRIELTRLERALPDDVGALIGRAKNLVEATAKAILEMQSQPVSNNDSVPALVSKASNALGVHVIQAAGPHLDQVKRVLSKLHGLTHDLAELRNLAGDGHGMTGVPVVDAAAGRLAARAAIAWCAFMLEVAMGAGPRPAKSA